MGFNNFEKIKRLEYAVGGFTQHYLFRKKDSAGFTLIEFLLYFGLITVIFISSSAMAFNIFSGKAKLVSIEEVSQNARLAMEKMIRVIGNAASINAPLISQSGSVLSLAMDDPSKDPTVFDAEGGVLTIKEGAGSAVELISDEVVGSQLLFSNISYADAPGAVRIELSIARENPQGANPYEFEKTFFTTANIRKK